MLKLDDTSVGEEFVFDVDGKFFYKHTQTWDSINQVLAQNELERNAGNNGYGESRELRKIASIPVMLDYEFSKKYGKDYIKNPKTLKRVLDENPYLRTC